MAAAVITAINHAKQIDFKQLWFLPTWPELAVETNELKDFM